MGQFGVTPGAGASINRWINSRRSLITGHVIAGIGLPDLALLTLGSVAFAAPVVLRGVTVTAPTLRAALEMTTTLSALAAAWLLRAQFGSSRRVRDLLLLDAVLVLGLINFAAAAVPAALDLQAGAYFGAARLCGLLFVATTFALAAFAPSPWLVASRRHPLAITAGVSVAGLLVAGLGGLLSRGHEQAHALPAAIGQPPVLVLVVAATGLLVYAAAGFAHCQRIEADRVSGLVAMAMMTLAGAGFSNVAAASLAPGQIGASEGLFALASVLVLAAAMVAERQVRARISKATALAERRRVARDLHDGIAQDLAFIAAHGPRFAQELGHDHPVVVAARRALALSRSTISELSDPEGATARESLEAVAQELRERFEIVIAVNAQIDRDLEFHTRAHVTRIAREAIANAARHGGARHVVVSLKRTGTGIALRIVDDGCGITGGDNVQAPEGFGLCSMRERAAALGGHLSVHHPARGGTELEVVLP